MKAIVQSVYGPAETLTLKEIDPPGAPGSGEVLVRVHAAGVDRGVWHMMTGLPYLIRLGSGLRAPKTRVRGMELAGRVEAVGANVTGLKPGDAVYGVGDGSFAELVRARADRLAPMPSNLSFEQAAAVPVSGVTALHAVRDKANVRSGQRVLVTGAGGGVGSFAVQLAKALGAEVTGVSGSSKVEFVRSLGADHVIDRTREEFAASGQLYDAIIDTAGRRGLPTLRRALTPKGAIVMVGGEGGGKLTGGFFGPMLRAGIARPFTGQRMLPLISIERSEDLQALTRFLETGSVTPAIDRVLPLAEAADALRRLESGHAQGKVVLKVAEA
ncbi:MAG TPA: NAD(P)-dependent alcohol dehydrogenase [Candidatus Limnocylindrales bacterium]